MNWKTKLLEIAKQKIDKDEVIHDLEHSFRVYKNCQLISKHLANIDMNILYAASLLHDTGYTINQFNEHGHISSRIAEKILRQIKFPKEKIFQVLEIIEEHDNYNWVKNHSKGKPRTLLSKIFQDADRLEIIGAIGIARNSAWAGKNNKPLWNAKKPLCPDRLYGGNISLIHTLDSHSYAYKNLNTSIAKRLGRKRQLFLKSYIKQFLLEWNHKL